MTPQEMVREFHERFGLAIDQPATRKLRELRCALTREEADESVEALEFGTLEQIALESADQVVVAYGNAIALGIDLDRVLRVVHESNMSRLGPDGKPIFRNDGKVLKGSNYRPPDLSFISDNRCPRCDSPSPHLHPAAQHQGEATFCPHSFHEE